MIYQSSIIYFLQLFHFNRLKCVLFFQAYNTKILITDIDNAYFDKNAREEVRRKSYLIMNNSVCITLLQLTLFYFIFVHTIQLHIFSNQIFRRSVEFTTCDFFTLNNHFITSVSLRLYVYKTFIIYQNGTKIKYLSIKIK